VRDTRQQPFQRSHHVHIPANDTAMRMNSIFERLKYYDKTLHSKLQELKIEPTVYGM
jgi:hypothetical protein